MHPRLSQCDIEHRRADGSYVRRELAITLFHSSKLSCDVYLITAVQEYHQNKSKTRLKKHNIWKVQDKLTVFKTEQIIICYYKHDNLET